MPIGKGSEFWILAGAVGLPASFWHGAVRSCMDSVAFAGFDLFGDGLLGKWQRLREYWRSGEFRVNFEQGSDRMMYIGVAAKSESALF